MKLLHWLAVSRCPGTQLRAILFVELEKCFSWFQVLREFVHDLWCQLPVFIISGVVEFLLYLESFGTRKKLFRIVSKIPTMLRNFQDDDCFLKKVYLKQFALVLTIWKGHNDLFLIVTTAEALRIVSSCKCSSAKEKYSIDLVNL